MSLDINKLPHIAPFSNTLHSECVPRESYARLLDRCNFLEGEISKLKAEFKSELATRDEVIQKLSEQLKLSRHMLFGKQSEVGEKIIDSTDGDDASASNDDTVTQQVSGYKRTVRKKNKSGRLVDTSKLPRYTITHDFPDSNPCCGRCGDLLKYLDKEITEKLEIIPKLVYCVEHERYKYSCDTCETVIMAPKPSDPIPKALAGTSLLTDTIISKVSYHLPFYRQSKILSHNNIDIPDNTIGAWLAGSANALSPLRVAYWRAVEDSKYLQVDETPVKILNPEKKGYIWIYYNPVLKFAVYDLSLTRGSINPEERLKNFEGKLQTDGYFGYNGLRDNSKTIYFNCNTHARRKFTDVLKITKNKNGIAAEAIRQLQEIYAIETYAKENNLSYDARKELRQTKAKPLWDKYKEWLQEQVKLVPPKSKLGNALQYSLNRLEYLTRYLEHGEVEIDTNGVENMVRIIALGRRNWLFIGNVDSGENYMLFYSLIQSCILQNIKPNIYIHYVLSKVHELRRGEINPDELLPHNINKQIL